MNENKKKAFMLLMTFLIIISYITSNAALNNGFSGPQQSSTSTVKSVRTYLVAGKANATVVGYSPTVLVSLSNRSNSSSGAVTGIFSRMESNGSISTYIYNSNNTFLVYMLNMNPYSLQQVLNAKLGNRTASVSTATYISLPRSVTLYYATVPISVSIDAKNYSIQVQPLRAPGSVFNVTISALVTDSGSVYNNQMRINYTR